MPRQKSCCCFPTSGRLPGTSGAASRLGSRRGLASTRSAGEGDHANVMIAKDDETWDVSVAVPYAVIDQVVQALRSL